MLFLSTKASQIMYSNGGDIIHSEILGEHGTELSKELNDIYGDTHREMRREGPGVSERNFKCKLSVSCRPNKPFRHSFVHLST